ncbi:AMIN-like domain-containing (lipo)protein [Pseudokineococcus sp. 1T1Z-3]|uniref:AMIN-like domain-containing (lipo)protein n=1 Tax=Pseudokineococcus sp. 1T1Z-3 TaxID=3132745 RepID=UPI003097D064
MTTPVPCTTTGCTTTGCTTTGAASLTATRAAAEVAAPRRSRAGAACALAAALLLGAGCGGNGVTAGPAESAVASTPAPTDVPTPEVAVSPTPSTTPSQASASTPRPDEEPSEEATGLPEDATTGTSEQASGGGPMSVVAVRSARREGYDRVVLELAGEEGEPGWFVQYTDEPTQQGSGDPVEVQGAATLVVVVRGLGYPFETGQEEVLGAFPGQGTSVLQEMLVGGVYEGQGQVFLGLSQEVPYTVTRLQDPPRVVVDLYGG